MFELVNVWEIVQLVRRAGAVEPRNTRRVNSCYSWKSYAE